MGILVQKFGGTSLSTPAAREHVIRHVKREMASGFDLVIVVSAMGRKGSLTQPTRCLTGQCRTGIPCRTGRKIS